MTPSVIARLRVLGACHEAVKWAEAQPSMSAAWRDCHRADWMMWLLGHLSGEPGGRKRRKLVLCATDCASTARRHTEGDTRQAFDRCIRACRRWANGEGTIEELREARGAVYAAYDSSATAAAIAAVYAAANAAAVAYTYTAAAYADLADLAAIGSAHVAPAEALASMAAIVRRHYPRPPRLPEVSK